MAWRNPGPRAAGLLPVLLALSVSTLATACRPARDGGAVPAPLSAVAALSAGSLDGFARALGPRTFHFPADHGPHPDYAVEWWYLTGNLEADDGRHFGFQLTFFQRALAPSMPARSSAWASRQLVLAHLALSDVAGDTFHAEERFSRAALGLAGARAAPFAVWLDDWSITAVEGAEGVEAGDGGLTARVAAAGDGFALALSIEARKPAVLHGDGGWSRKGEAPGNASYYYSLTRLATRGTVTVGGRPVTVTGTSWLDREWSTSVLEAGTVGWDWLALQLDDGRDLMLFRLRRRGGGVAPASHGTLVAADGSARHLRAGDVTLEVFARWRSRRGVRYPAAWRLTVPSADLALRIEPWMADQELDLSFRYWEGAVRAAGTAAGRPLRADGYVELVGYERTEGSEAP